MIKKLLFISSLLIASFIQAQSPPLQKPISYGYEFQRLLTDTLLGIPKDTFAIPTVFRPFHWIAAKGDSIYKWSPTQLKWVLVQGGGGSGGFFSPNQTALVNTIHDANNHDFVIDSASNMTFHLKKDNLSQFDIFAGHGFYAEVKGVNSGFNYWGYYDLWDDFNYMYVSTGNGENYIQQDVSNTTSQLTLKSFVSGAGSQLWLYNDAITLKQPQGIVKIDSLNHTTDTTGYYLVVKKRGGAFADNLQTLSFSAISGSNLVFNESVVKSNDSVFLRNEKLQPAAEKTTYGFLNGTYGYKPTQVINTGGIQHNDIFIYDTTTTEIYPYHSSQINGRMQFKARATNWIATNDSVLIDSNLIDRFIYFVSVDGFPYTSLPSGVNDKWYEFYSSSGSITIHPSPTNDSASVIILHGWAGMWSENSRRTAPIPPSFSNFDYSSTGGSGGNPDIEETSAGSHIWQISGTGTSPYTGVGAGSIKIAASADGAYRVQWNSTDGYFIIIGFDATTTENSYANWDYWAETDAGGTIYVNENSAGSINTGVTVSNGDYLAIWRDGTTGAVTCKKSVDGINWTLVYNYPTATTAIIYPKVQIDNATKKIYNPMGYHIN